MDGTAAAPDVCWVLLHDSMRKIDVCVIIIINARLQSQDQTPKRTRAAPWSAWAHHPTPLWSGLWPSRVSTAWASALPPSQLLTSEQRSAGDAQEGDSEGEGNRWPGANLLCTLTQSPLHATLPHPTRFFLYSNFLTHGLEVSLCSALFSEPSSLLHSRDQQHARQDKQEF